MALDKADIPDIFTDKQGTALPIESVSGAGPDKTVFLKIDLEIKLLNAAEEKPAELMTAVFAPDPTQLGDSEVDILLYFHGHKKGDLDHVTMSGLTAQQYLQHPKFQLREAILNKTNKKQFLLVVPTLGDRSEAGLLNKQDQAEAFLQQILNGAQKHLGIKAKAIGEIVLAAHSGGGAIMSTTTKYGGIFENDDQGKHGVQEIWCLDCMYGSGETFKTWIKKPIHSLDKLWVFSTGEFPTGQNPKLPVTPANPAAGLSGTGNDAKLLYDHAMGTKPPRPHIFVRINNIAVLDSTKPDNEKSIGSFTTPNFMPFGFANEHNQSVLFYFDKLVTDSSTLS